MTPSLTMIDSGNETKAVYDFCKWCRDEKGFNGVLPCKGSTTDLGGEPYRMSILGRQGHKSNQREAAAGHQGQMLIWVNTDFWETELQARLDQRRPGEPGSLSLPDAASKDLALLDDLLNGVLSDAVDRRGNERYLWVKKDPGKPNDFRDALRYGLCAAQVWIDDQGGVPERGDYHSDSKPAVVSQGASRPDGRPWI